MAGSGRPAPARCGRAGSRSGELRPGAPHLLTVHDEVVAAFALVFSDGGRRMPGSLKSASRARLLAMLGGRNSLLVGAVLCDGAGDERVAEDARCRCGRFAEDAFLNGSLEPNRLAITRAVQGPHSAPEDLDVSGSGHATRCGLPPELWLVLGDERAVVAGSRRRTTGWDSIHQPRPRCDTRRSRARPDRRRAAGRSSLDGEDARRPHVKPMELHGPPHTCAASATNDPATATASSRSHGHRHRECREN